jgi:hypothetical protein
MSDINALKAQKYLEVESKRRDTEVKQIRAENNKAFESEVAKGENEIKRLKEDYETKIGNIKNEQEQKLSEIRDRQIKSVNDENERMQEELVNLKSTHQQQLAEIKTSNEAAIKEVTDSHKKTMATAQVKFGKEKAKLNS